MSRRTVKAGSPEPLGAMPDEHGVNFAVYSHYAESIEICLFDAAGEREVERVRLPERTGDVFHGHIADVPVGSRYGLRAHGPYDPAAGQRFNPHKLLVDPQALVIDRPFRLHSSMFGYRRGDPAGDLSYDETDSAPSMPKAIIMPPPGPVASPAQRVPWNETILYELHVRGFSRRNERVPTELRGTFAGLAHPASIEHLTKLGITSIEIMPCAAWVDERHLADLGLTNYWGYNPVPYGAPDPRLAPGGWTEIRQTVAALHAAGLEVIVDVVLNHSGEGDEYGPTLSLRGLDNSTYYRLGADRRCYIDDAGCGNCLALDRPPVLRLAMDALRTWVRLAGIDGFRFDLATTLARRAEGFDPAAPIIGAINQDPELRGLKLIAEPWDIGPGGYQLGAFPAGWGEWNDRFRDGVRRFWRGDGGLVGEVATRFAGSADVFSTKAGPSRSINFVTAHDGFTLADLVSYEGKHNETNGEHNRDGTNANHSWNHGVEGPTTSEPVVRARARDQRNLLATLVLARGTPMLAMGGEFGHSQRGNNNAYAQDNEISWLDWEAADAGLFDFTSRLIRLRREHPALRQDGFLTGRPPIDGFLPDVEWLNARGMPMSGADWHTSSTLVATFSAAAPGAMLDRVVVVLHAGGDGIDVQLPEPRDGYLWIRGLDSAAKGELAGEWSAAADFVAVAPRSVVVLVEASAPAGTTSKSRGAEPEVLAALGRAAGIADHWWDVGGTRFEVGSDTRRVLLEAMGFPVATRMQARASLARLSAGTDRRAIPSALVRREGEPVEIRLTDQGSGHRPAFIEIGVEGGIAQAVRLGKGNCRETRFTAIDGRECRGWIATLPPQPIGRHRLWRDDAPDLPGRLTIAPARCYLPPALAEGQHRYGVAAHLYTLRRQGDQGIGDFTTLRRFAKLAGDRGSSIVGLNPLHALFGGDRDRASPYHPSDRRFLDPIYIDVAALDDLPPAVGSDPPPVCASTDIVDYVGVWALKSAALAGRFEAFETLAAGSPEHPIVRAFHAFVAEGGSALRRFACFEAISERYPGDFRRDWPVGLRDPASTDVAEFAARHEARLRHHMFLQWLADRQLGAAAASASGLGFYRDLAIGAAYEGAEAWAEAENLVSGVSIGAPPDPFSARGQIWNLPCINPLKLPASNFEPFIRPIAANMRHAGALRIDHAMGLTRLFLVPEGAEPSEGTYVAYPLEELLGQLALESQRHSCAVVGEDLGTVPEGFRERLAAADVLSYRVLWFERDAKGFKPPSAYPAKSVACVATHDLPTLIGWWAGDDIDERLDLGLLTADAATAERVEREKEKLELVDRLLSEGDLTARPVLSAPLDADFAAAAHAYLARSSAALVLAQADDLAGERRAVNLPGTDRERPNWRRKLEPDIEQLFAGDLATRIMAALARTRGPTA